MPGMCGAVAICVHGFVRATQGIDLLICATSENVERIRAALSSVYELSRNRFPEPIRVDGNSKPNRIRSGSHRDHKPYKEMRGMFVRNPPEQWKGLLVLHLLVRMLA